MTRSIQSPIEIQMPGIAKWLSCWSQDAVKAELVRTEGDVSKARDLSVAWLHRALSLIYGILWLMGLSNDFPKNMQFHGLKLHMFVPYVSAWNPDQEAMIKSYKDAPDVDEAADDAALDMIDAQETGEEEPPEDDEITNS